MANAGFLGSKPVSSPLITTSTLYQQNSSPLHDPSTYRQLIRRLLYLTTSRPDVFFAIQPLSQFVAHSTEVHLSAVHGF